MIPLEKIIKFIKPIDVIGKTTSYVSNPIKLTELNTNEDVLMWVSKKNTALLASVKAGIIICPEVEKENYQSNCTYIICSNPRLVFQQVLSEFFLPQRAIGIAPTAYIAPTSKLGENIYIGHNVVIEADCVIGNNTSIGHNTVLKSQTHIGAHVIIGSNNTIGGVGFGYEKDMDGQYMFLPHLGNVVIEDYVEIGNNTCIDRAVLGSTLIQKNAKIDNLVHIAHGVEIGENSLIIGTSQIAGSVRIGKNCWIAPSSTIINKITIGDNVIVGIGSVVLKDVEAHHTVMGNPARVISKG
jgi:UDP-3-O-[3-hydroxymyristoyl] glucosamine N-acyltransferase